MSRQIFLVYFLLMFVFCQLCRQECAALSNQVQNTDKENTFFEFFKVENKKLSVLNSQGVEKNAQVTVNHIGSVSFVAAESVMVAIAEVSEKEINDDKEERDIKLLAKFIDNKESNWSDGAIKADLDKWKIQLAAEKIKKQKDAVIKSFAVAAENDKIYYFMVSNNTLKSDGSPDHSTAKKWHVRLAEGTVTGGSGEGKTMKWISSEIDVSYDSIKLKGQLNSTPTNILPLDGFGFVTRDKNIFFVINGREDTTGSSSSDKKNITVVFQLESNTAKSLKLMHVENTVGCPVLFFHWEEKIVLTSTSCTNSLGHDIKVFDKDGKKFNGKERPISFVWDFLKDKTNVAPALIKNEKNVLLFTQQKKEDEEKNAYLWMTDGTRVSLAGSFVIETKETLYMSIVYTEKELFALHQQYNQIGGTKDDNKFTLRRLKEQLKNITTILQAWKKDDENIKQFCQNKNNNQNSICTSPLPKSGLVGFLHNKFNIERKEWKDEYYYTNATVENGNMLINGLKFGGKGAGSKWPIGKPENDQPYSFNNSGFTLVATVNIGETTNGKENSILGVGFDDTQKNFGLWCTANGKWSVKKGPAQTKVQTSSVECKHDKIYYLTLILKGGKISVYINEKQIIDSDVNEINIEKLKYFYFGTDIGVPSAKNKIESHLIISNVFLYNRPFEDDEIDNLKKYIKTLEVPTPPDGNTREQPKNNTGSGSDQQALPTPLPTDSNKKEEEGPSPSRTEDGGVGGGVRVFSLLLAVLCVSAPLLHM